jgi:hypothetical protein
VIKNQCALSAVSKEDRYETWYNTDKIKEAEIATIKKQTDFSTRAGRKSPGQGMGDPSAETDD